MLFLFLKDIRAIERKTAADLKRRMQILNGEIPEDEEGSDVEESGDTQLPSYSDVASSNINVGKSNSKSNTSVDGERTADSIGLPSKSTEKGHQEVRETFNSIEYSEAEIPNIIPKPSEKLPRKSSVGHGIGSTAVMKRSRSGGLSTEKSSLDQCEGTIMYLLSNRDIRT